MREACSLVWLALVGLFRSRASLEAEILILRHQLNIQRRQSPKRLNFSTLDQIVLALEIEALRRPADGAAGNTRADPRDEYRQSTLGSATNSWRAAQARHRNRTDQRGQVYGQAEMSAIPGLEDVPPQSCRRHRGDGSVRRTDDLISLALWLVNHGAWSTTGFMVWRDRASDRRRDRNQITQA